MSNAWNADLENATNKKYFHRHTSEGGHIDEFVTDIDIAMKASMYYWKMKGINNIADTDDIKAVTKKVNGGTNGLDLRQSYTNKAKKVFK